MRTAAWLSAACCVATLYTRPAAAQERTLPAVELEAEAEVSPMPEPGNRDVLIAYRTLEIATAGAFAATAVFGAIQAYNMPTLFGSGACGFRHPDERADEPAGGGSTGGGSYGGSGAYQTSEDDGPDPIFGDYACRGALGVVHGVLGVGSTLLYSATDIVGNFAPDDDHGDDLAVTTLGWVSRITLALTAVAGLMGANPFNMFSIDDEGTEYDFQRTMRTVHMGLAAVSATSYLTRVAIDIF